MEKNKKEFASWGVMALVFAFCDLLTLIGSVIDEFDALKFVMSGSVPMMPVYGIVIMLVSVAMCAIILLLQFLLGVKSIQLCKAPSAVKWHIGLAKALAIVQIVLTAFAAIDVIFSTAISPTTFWDYLDVVVCVINIIVLFLYAKFAKRVREDYLKENKA